MATFLNYLLFAFVWTAAFVSVNAWSESPNQFDPFAFALLNSNQELDCSLGFCEALNDVGPPPDDILFLPPPPIPPQFAHLLQNKHSTNSSYECSLCDSLADASAFAASGRSESGPVGPSLNRTQTDHESWLSLLVASILASSVLGTVFILLLARCRRWKPFPVASCQMLATNLLGNGSSKIPPNCGSTSDSCMSPVVNEKSPQSIIPSSPCKRSTTIIPSKYWRTSHCPIDLHSPSQQTPLEQSASTTELDEYTGCGEAGSCTSSPVYAELDAHQQITQLLHQHHQNQLSQSSAQPLSTQISAAQLTQTIPFGANSLLNTYAEPMPTHLMTQSRSNCTQIRLSGANTPNSAASNTYAVHTYAELPEPVRVNRIISNGPLLPDVSYDNAAYLPSSTSDHHQYQNRSLRRQRTSNSNQLGSTTPLLGSAGYYGNTLHSHMTTGNRSNKKQRNFLMQHAQQQSMGGSRMNVNSPATLVSLRTDLSENESLDLQPRYVQTSGRGSLVHEIYNECAGGESSPSVASFRTLSYKDQSKNRPLPPVPGVRL